MTGIGARFLMYIIYSIIQNSKKYILLFRELKDL